MRSEFELHDVAVWAMLNGLETEKEPVVTRPEHVGRQADVGGRGVGFRGCAGCERDFGVGIVDDKSRLGRDAGLASALCGNLQDEGIGTAENLLGDVGIQTLHFFPVDVEGATGVGLADIPHCPGALRRQQKHRRGKQYQRAKDDHGQARQG